MPSRKPRKQDTRECMPCTACCDGWVQINVYGEDVYPGRPCPHSTGHSCRIYENRPRDPCREFICGWRMEGSPYPDWMRPDQAKVMVLPHMRTWRGRPVDVAVPVGKRIPPRVLKWLQDYALRTQRPLIYTEQDLTREGYARDQQVIGFGPPEFQEEVRRLVESGAKLW